MTKQTPTMQKASVLIAVPEGQAPGQFYGKLFDFVDHVHKLKQEHDYKMFTPDNRRVWKLCLKFGSAN